MKKILFLLLLVSSLCSAQVTSLTLPYGLKMNTSNRSALKSYLNNSNLPYTDAAEVLSQNVVRHRGQKFFVSGGIEYWFKDGIEDGDLIIYSSGGSVDTTAFIKTQGTSILTSDIEIISDGVSRRVKFGDQATDSLAGFQAYTRHLPSSYFAHFAVEAYSAEGTFYAQSGKLGEGSATIFNSGAAFGPASFNFQSFTNTGGKSIYFRMNADSLTEAGLQFEDQRDNPLGLTYKDNYASTFVDRSLVDKHYVDSVATGGGGGGADALGTYLVQTATNAPANAQIMGSLATGIVKNTTTTGVQSIAVAGDFPTLNQNTTGSAATLTTARTIGTATGDVTSAGSTFNGSANNTNAYTIANDAVTLAKMANMATASLIYRKTGGTGDPEVNTLATLKTDLGLTGTNSGDQTSIVGITGTKAEFNTAVSDGNIIFEGTNNITGSFGIVGDYNVLFDQSGTANLKIKNDTYFEVDAPQLLMSRTAAEIIAAATTTAGGGLIIPHGVAPTSPTNGQFWTTTTSAFARINGVTIDLGASGGGSGDVVGPSSSVAGTLALFDGTTGKLLKEAVSATNRVTSDGGQILFEKVSSVTGNNLIRASNGGAGENHAMGLLLLGGNASGSNYDGGDVIIQSGNPHGSGAKGAIQIADSADKLGFFEVTPVIKQSAPTTAQGIADVLTAYGLIPSSTISGGGGSGLTYSQVSALSVIGN